MAFAAVCPGADSPEDLFQQGVELFEARSFERSEAVLRRVLEADPSRLQARLYLIRGLIASRQGAEAVRELSKLAALHGGDPEALYHAGLFLEQLAGLRIQDLERLAPDSPEARMLAAKHHETSGRPKQALAEYERVREQDPDRQGIHFLTGSVHWKLQNFDAALDALLTELKNNPGHIRANYLAGSIYLLQNRLPAAVEHLEKAVQGDPDFLEARRELGKALRMAGEFEAALRHLQAVAERRPRDDRIHAQLAAVYREMGDRERAAAEMKLHQQILREKFDSARESFERRKDSAPGREESR